MPRPLFPLLILLAALLGCDSAPDDPVLRIGVIAEDGEMVRHGSRLSWPAQAYRAATAQGLVALDQEGRIVPALAERWLVTDDGLSYIFRLRDTRWAGGTPVTAQDARRSLENAIRALAGTSLGLDLAPVAEVRAMTGRVIEITLDTPQPTLLQLLAQPELGLVLPGAGGGGGWRHGADGADRADRLARPDRGRRHAARPAAARSARPAGGRGLARGCPPARSGTAQRRARRRGVPARRARPRHRRDAGRPAAGDRRAALAREFAGRRRARPVRAARAADGGAAGDPGLARGGGDGDRPRHAARAARARWLGDDHAAGSAG